MAKAGAEHSTEFIPLGWETPRQALVRKVAEGRLADEVRNTLQSALMLGHLAAAEPTRQAYFRDLSDYLPGLSIRGLAQADQAAVRSLGRGFAIPREAWCHWVEDGSFNFDHDEVPRLFPGRIERFRPLLQIEDVDRLILQPDQRVPEQTASASLVDETPMTEATENVEKQSAAPAEEVDRFKTGTAGRPTAKHLILAEFEQRLKDCKIEPKDGELTKCSKAMAEWWERTRGQGPKMAHGTITNILRNRWRAAITERMKSRT
jgi:hypothetical protein